LFITKRVNSHLTSLVAAGRDERFFLRTRPVQNFVWIMGVIIRLRWELFITEIVCEREIFSVFMAQIELFFTQCGTTKILSCHIE